MTSVRRGGKPLPSDWRKRRAQVLKRDPICRACGARPSTQVDHIIPSGSDEETNLQGMCGPCHDIKTKKEAAEGARRAAQRRRKARTRPSEPHPGLITGGG